MDEKISQSELEKDLWNLVLNIEDKKELEFAKYYIKAWENKNYDVKEFRDYIQVLNYLSKSEDCY